MDDKLTPIEHALVAALVMPRLQAEEVLKQICENGLKLEEDEQEASF